MYKLKLAIWTIQKGSPYWLNKGLLLSIVDRYLIFRNTRQQVVAVFTFLLWSTFRCLVDFWILITKTILDTTCHEMMSFTRFIHPYFWRAVIKVYPGGMSLSYKHTEFKPTYSVITVSSRESRVNLAPVAGTITWDQSFCLVIPELFISLPPSVTIF